MNSNSFDITSSVFWGFLCVVLLFVLSLLLVVGAKAVILYIKQMVDKIRYLPSEKDFKPAPPKKSTVKKAEKPIRSIEINPDEVDRIYVKKIS